MRRASTKPVTEDLYRFFDREFLVRSDIPAISDHLRFVYGRFLLDSGSVKEASDGERLAEGGPLIVRIEDHFESSRELLLDFCGQVRRLPCRDIATLDSYPGDPTDPASTVQGLLLHTVSRFSESRFLVHAAAVSRDGKGAVLAGNVGMGKTTTALKLVHRGFGFLSDEVASFPLGEEILEPFHRTVNLRNDTADLLGIRPRDTGALERTDGIETFWTVDVDSIFPGSLSGACVPRFLLFLQGFGEETRLAPMSPSSALFRLVRFSHRPVADPGSLLYALAPIVGRLRCHSLVIGESDDPADRIEELFLDDARGAARATG